MEFELTSVPSVSACVCDLSVGWLVWRPARLQAMNVSGTYLEAWDGVRRTYELRTNRGLAYSRISTVHMTPCSGHAGREKNVDGDNWADVIRVFFRLSVTVSLLQFLELQPPLTTTGD